MVNLKKTVASLLAVTAIISSMSVGASAATIYSTGATSYGSSSSSTSGTSTNEEAALLKKAKSTRMAIDNKVKSLITSAAKSKKTSVSDSTYGITIKISYSSDGSYEAAVVQKQNKALSTGETYQYTCTAQCKSTRKVTRVGKSLKTTYVPGAYTYYSEIVMKSKSGNIQVSCDSKGKSSSSCASNSSTPTSYGTSTTSSSGSSSTSSTGTSSNRSVSSGTNSGFNAASSGMSGSSSNSSSSSGTNSGSGSSSGSSWNGGVSRSSGLNIDAKSMTGSGTFKSPYKAVKGTLTVRAPGKLTKTTKTTVNGRKVTVLTYKGANSNDTVYVQKGSILYKYVLTK